MPVFGFDQLVGSAGDVQELEYISALHQTDLKELRKDASLRAEDIRVYLRSSHGVKVTEADVRNNVLAGLVTSQTQDGVFDLMEVVAALYIPTILKAAENLRIQDVDGDREGINETSDMEQIESAEGVIPVPTEIIENVLDTILEDVTGDSSAKPLTPDLVKSILGAYGEYGLAADETLVQEMVDQGKRLYSTEYLGGIPRDDEAPPMLDCNAFADSLTSDVRLYNTQTEDEEKSNLDAIMNMHYRETSAGGLYQYEIKYDDLKRKHMIDSIDMSAATYRSTGLTAFLWATIVITYFAYFEVFNANLRESCGAEYTFDKYDPWRENISAIKCTVVRGISNWLYLFGVMSFFGIGLSLLGNSGNSSRSRRLWRTIVGLCSIVGLVVGPYVYFRDDATGFLYQVSLGLGLITCSFHLRHIVASFMPRWLPKGSTKSTIWRLLFSSTPAEMYTRQAAARKMSCMAVNALETFSALPNDGSVSSNYGKALQNYTTSGRKFKKVGGFLWSWQHILSGKRPFLRDGIWIPGRMIASNIAQYIVAIYILFAGATLIKDVSDNYRSAKMLVDFVWYAKRTMDLEADSETDDGIVNNLVANVTSVVASFMPAVQESVKNFGCGSATLTAKEILRSYCYDVDGVLRCNHDAPVNFLCPLVDPEVRQSLDPATQQAFLVGAGFNEDLLREVTQSASEEAIANNLFDSFYPSEKYMVMIPLIAGTVFAVCLAFFLASTYIPSVITTVIKLRSGNILTLTDEEFVHYRESQSDVTYMTGSMFWGALLGSVLSGGLFALVIFLFMWQATVFFAQRLVAFTLGIMVVSGIRVILVWIIFSWLAPYRAFYRERPAATNLGTISLEWANFTVAVGFIFLRVFQFAGAAAVFIGRLDTHFLSQDIKRFGYIKFDEYPMVHTKDILAQEAHRHPYIQQLGIIYLMRLRYGQHFGNRAGSAWRLIFVHALMPWLYQYRLAARHRQIESAQSLELQSKYPSLANREFRRSTLVRDSSASLSFRLSSPMRSSIIPRPILEQRSTSKTSSVSEASEDSSTKVTSSQPETSKVLELEREIEQLRKALARATANSSNDQSATIEEKESADQFALGGERYASASSHEEQDAAREVQIATSPLRGDRNAPVSSHEDQDAAREVEIVASPIHQQPGTEETYSTSSNSYGGHFEESEIMAMGSTRSAATPSEKQVVVTETEAAPSSNENAGDGVVEC